MDKLHAMRTFVRVVEAGSFSAVAKEAHATQSAVSKQVAALEAMLGAKLLSRTTRSLALTEEGERYFEQARRLLADIDEAESSLKRGNRQLRGWLRVAASVGFGRLQLMPLVRTFLAKHPDVKIDLRLNDGFVDLVERGIDMAVRIGDLPDSSLVAHPVGTSWRGLVASKAYLRKLPKGSRAPKTLDDLAAHNCIVYTGAPMRNTWRFVAGPGAKVAEDTVRTVKVEGNLQTDSSEVIRASILAGVGIGYAPLWMFERELASGEVQHLLPEWRASTPITLVFPQERKHSAKVRAFTEHLERALRERQAHSK